MNKSLEELRTEIDEIDKKLVEDLAIRFRVVAEVKELKKENDLPTQDHKREQQLLIRIADLAAENAFDPRIAQEIFRTILAESRKSQEKTDN